MLRILFFIGLVFTLISCDSSQKPKTIGIIIPIEHRAMNEIVAGFEKSLRANFHEPLQFQVMNAQGDINIQRAILSQMKNRHDDMIVPIGTDATQMTLAMIKHQPIVSLAAVISEQDRRSLKHCNIAVVHDEISPKKLLDFIKLAYPDIKKIVLIHSASEKVFPEVKATIQTGKDLGMEIKPVMVPTLQELFSAAQSLPHDINAILVLKDSLIVSGISTLAITAAKMHIPLITSDQGSVQEGAGFSLGVHESAIGEKGGLLASQILAGINPCKIPVVEMKKLTVFVNQKALENEQQSLTNLQITAKKKNYVVEIYAAADKNHD